MRRSVGIIIFALGLLLFVAGLMKLIQGVAGMGIFALFIGLVIFGLSFIPQPDPGPDAPPPLSPADRITSIFYEPERIFKHLRYHPRWLAAFLIIALFGIVGPFSGLVYKAAYTQRLTPELIAATTIDKVIEGGWFPPERASQIRAQTIEAAKLPVARITEPLDNIIFIFIFMLILAGLYLLCVLAFGGRMNFWQALSVATYGSLPPAVLQGLLSVILLYVKAPEDIDPIKGQRGLARADLGLLFAPTDHPYLYVIASLISVFSLYGWWLTVTGFRHTAQKISGPSAWVIALLLWLLGAVIRLVLAAVFPNFVA